MVIQHTIRDLHDAVNALKKYCKSRAQQVA